MVIPIYNKAQLSPSNLNLRHAFSKRDFFSCLFVDIKPSSSSSLYNGSVSGQLLSLATSERVGRKSFIPIQSCSQVRSKFSSASLPIYYTPISFLWCTQGKKHMAKKALPILLFIPYLIIVVLGIILFLSGNTTIFKALFVILIITFLLSVGILLGKLTGFFELLGLQDCVRPAVSNPNSGSNSSSNSVSTTYSPQRLTEILGIWSLTAVLILGFYALINLPEFTSNVNKFMLEAYEVMEHYKGENPTDF